MYLSAITFWVLKRLLFSSLLFLFLSYTTSSSGVKRGRSRYSEFKDKKDILKWYGSKVPDQKSCNFTQLVVYFADKHPAAT